MNNPLRRLKQLPWFPLFQIAGLTVFLAIVLELLLMVAAGQMPIVREILRFLFTPPLGLIVAIAISMGFGALAVYLLERIHARNVFINSGVLWALILCLLILMLVTTLLNVGSAFLTPDQSTLIGLIVGVFWKGRRHWRRW